MICLFIRASGSSSGWGCAQSVMPPVLPAQPVSRPPHCCPGLPGPAARAGFGAWAQTEVGSARGGAGQGPPVLTEDTVCIYCSLHLAPCSRKSPLPPSLGLSRGSPSVQRSPGSFQGFSEALAPARPLWGTGEQGTVCVPHHKSWGMLSHTGTPAPGCQPHAPRCQPLVRFPFPPGLVKLSCKTCKPSSIKLPIHSADISCAGALRSICWFEVRFLFVLGAPLLSALAVLPALYSLPGSIHGRENW